CRDHARGVAWELGNIELFAGGALTYLGEWGALRARVPEMLREARERDDRYALAGFALLSGTWLAADEPVEARRQADGAAAGQSPSEFHTQSYLALLAQAPIDLYLGAGANAWKRVTGAWRPLARSQLLRAEHIRVEMRHLRARCAVAMLAEDAGRAVRVPGDPSWRRASLLRFVASEARRLAADTLPTAQPFAQL